MGRTQVPKDTRSVGHMVRRRQAQKDQSSVVHGMRRTQIQEEIRSRSHKIRWVEFSNKQDQKNTIGHKFSETPIQVYTISA